MPPVERLGEEQERDAGRVVLARAQLVDLQRPLALHLLGIEGGRADPLGEEVEAFGKVAGEELRAQPEAVAAGVAAE